MRWFRAFLVGIACLVLLPVAAPRFGSRTARASEADATELHEQTESLHDAFEQLEKAVGGLTAGQRAKAEAVEKNAVEKLKTALPQFKSREDRDAFFQHEVLLPYREILTAEQREKLVAAMKSNAERMRQVATSANLKQVVVAIMIYCNDHGGKLPPDLGALASQDIEPQTFLASGSAKPLPADWAKWDAKRKADWINQNTDFVYLGSGGTPLRTLRDDFVIAYLKPDSGVPFHVFALANGSVFPAEQKEWDALQAALQSGQNPPPAGTVKEE